MLGETKKKPKLYRGGRDDGDPLACILKATKTTLRQNVISIIM